ncbi:hypothetical protein SSP24_26680 [Streptomyces spinoverrucosus]|uniref:Uncharacterized protein n=1 Tax=Streptomyces spinoverrucosus TaxID=284043 RepID=A0A4Y3VEX1_9ACTN|nr:hypothetical protein SSP24_26680 [Streptomyces spinoverrucosus]GHB96565.1 hypothetical protein GCM10010397_81490 [Streptomyces spinoverrucosus]
MARVGVHVRTAQMIAFRRSSSRANRSSRGAGDRREDADVLTGQDAPALLDEMVGVGLDLVGPARGDESLHPPGVQVDAQAETAERGRRPLQHVTHGVRTRGRDRQPLGVYGQSVGPEPGVHLFGAVPHPFRSRARDA